MAAFALTIFTGAFLLFQVQPLIGKYILPWFGGGPGVWTTCMLFFQALLLGGYAYAHFSSRWLKPRAQALVHLALLAAALALLPITPSEAWKPHGGENPTLQILLLLTVSLGLPYFVLSATGPLLQQWFSLTHPGRSPYRLYALSNVGSLLALVSYPFFFETHFTRKFQAGLWAWGLGVYAVCCGACAWKLFKSKVQCPRSKAQTLPEPTPPQAPSLVQMALWLLLPACASVLLLATTNKLCLDVAVIPFLWVLPLALYLLTFIICFDSPRWYARFPFTLALIAALGGIYWALFHGTDASLYQQVAIYCGGLFVCCLVCHGELYRLRPDPRYLTTFYLLIAAGGALGGLFVAVAAPLIFTGYYELHWGLALCGLLFFLVVVKDWGVSGSAPAPERRSLLRDPAVSWRWLACTLPLVGFGGLDRLLAGCAGRYKAIPASCFLSLRAGMWLLLAFMVISFIARRKFSAFRYWRGLACAWLGLGWCVLALLLWTHGRQTDKEIVHTSRNFYGVLTVYERSKNEPASHHFVLQHGRITHGLQFTDPAQSVWPTSYYSEESGIGLACRALPAGPRRIGVVGLGTGSLTVYGRAGDYMRIYEIDPHVQVVATNLFSYLAKCPAKVELAPGDARLSMEKEPPQHFDLLALDAFSSDAIPVHLLTREAFEVYERHLQTNGIIAIHISNQFLDLEPVVANLGRQFHYEMAVINFDENGEDWWLYASTWVLLTRDAKILKSSAIANYADPPKNKPSTVPLWTDDFASLFQILN